jgi:chemotaxis protein CheD
MDDGRIDRFLAPGEVAIGNARHRLRTLLGSCVAIVLWDPATRFGAMSHFLLPPRMPLRGPQGGPNAGRLDGRYADDAMALMLRGLARHQVAPRHCAVHLLGGGSMFPQQAEHGDVGRRNGEAARTLLRAHGLRADSERLFGSGHRLVVFDLSTGQVQAQQVAPEEAADLPPSPSRLPGASAGRRNA